MMLSNGNDNNNKYKYNFMGNIMSLKNVKNKPSRSGFDLSKRNLFTSKCGELLPIYCKELLPDDYAEIEISNLTRTAPVATPAMTRIREYYDFFFVPTRLMWDKFPSFIAQTDDVDVASSITSKAILGDTHPYITRSDLHQYLSYLLQVEPGRVQDSNIFNYSRGALSCKLLEYLGYGSFFDHTKGGDQTSLVPYVHDVAMNPFPLLAYQKIYQDYFRNTQWESSAPWTCNLNYMNPTSSTASMKIDFDQLGATTSPTYNTFLDLRYANWNKDYFLGVLPNSQFGDAASINIGGLFLKSHDGNVSGSQLNFTNFGFTDIPPVSKNTINNYPLYNQYVELTEGSPSLTLGADSNLNLLQPYTMIPILALRQAEAMQKWKEITQAHAKDYKSQMEAHFGVTMSDVHSTRCKFINGVVNTIDISEVANTNITGENKADLAGKGVGVGNGKVKFHCKEHGYIMCIYHSVPVMDYSITGVQRQNLKTVVTDYAIPEFDRTGMVQIPMVELINTPIEDVDLSANSFLGYAPRYIDYKTDYDVVNGNFKFGDSNWVSAFDTSYIEDYIKSANQNNLINRDSLSLNYVFFKVNPNILDKIFEASVDSFVSTDQFKTNCYFNVHMTRNLDYNGLPY